LPATVFSIRSVARTLCSGTIQKYVAYPGILSCATSFANTFGSPPTTEFIATEATPPSPAGTSFQVASVQSFPTLSTPTRYTGMLSALSLIFDSFVREIGLPSDQAFRSDRVRSKPPSEGDLPVQV